MANAIRSTKSGCKWTREELNAYNISIVFEDKQTFFGTDQLPEPQIASEILSNEHEMRESYNIDLINLLEHAMASAEIGGAVRESRVADFAVQLLRSLGYTSASRVACTKWDIPLTMCGNRTHAETNACIYDRENKGLLLLVQEDELFADAPDAQPQLIAGAIAAFQFNNLQRESNGLEALSEMLIPGITMNGTATTFFKIPITAQLDQAVVCGMYPNQPTIVHTYVPQLPRPACRLSEGMVPLDNRRIFLECYEAFKQFMI